MPDNSPDGLRRDLDSLGGSFLTMEEELRETRAAVQEVSDFLGIPKGESSQPWRWEEMDRDQARNAWRLVKPFVAMLIKRYSYRDHKIGPCWFAHPELMDHLSALYWAYKLSYRPNVDRSAPMYWVQTYLPNTLDILSKQAAACRNSCEVLEMSISQLTEEFREGWMNDWIKTCDQPQVDGSDG